MGRRIDIELTSKREDGTWTWRAPGAREPRGVVDGELIPPDATPGNVLRAEADFDLEGILVTSILGTKSTDRKGREGERIEILGTAAPKSTVSVSLASRGDRPRRSGLFDEGRPPRRKGGPGGPRGDRTGGESDGKARGRRPERRPDSRPDSSPDSRP